MGHSEYRSLTLLLVIFILLEWLLITTMTCENVRLYQYVVIFSSVNIL